LAFANENPTERALSFARLPDSLDGWRVLAIGGGDPGRGYLTGIGADEYVALDQPTPDPELETGGFDLVICGSSLETDVHPLSLFAWMRRAIKPEGALVAGSRVLSDPTKSQYARYVPAAAMGVHSRWLPGRLAFRWMVEVSGFDVDGWLAGVGQKGESEEQAYLQARPADRAPVLDLDRQPLHR
jgi:hypothetical protein